MITTLIVLATATVFFILYAWLCAIEAERGKRLFLTLVRLALDSALVSFGATVRRKLTYIGRYIITLSWYYSLHAFLRLVLQFLGSVYTVLEAVLHRNRDKARQIRRERKQAERSHLTALAEHKVETALTPHQKEKRKAKALNGK